PILLGGFKVQVLPMIVYEQVLSVFDWPFGAANALVLLVISVLLLAVYFTFRPQGFSLKWFANFFQRREFMQALWLSTEIALWTALISTVIGTAAALVLVRGRFRGRDLLNAFVTSPL